jgi:hypothetical protein
MHEGTAHDRRGQALVDDLGELADDFDFHHDPSLASRKTQYALTIRSPKDVARAKAHRKTIPQIWTAVLGAYYHRQRYAPGTK